MEFLIQWLRNDTTADLAHYKEKRAFQIDQTHQQKRVSNSRKYTKYRNAGFSRQARSPNPNPKSGR